MCVSEISSAHFIEAKHGTVPMFTAAHFILVHFWIFLKMSDYINCNKTYQTCYTGCYPIT